jgi:hypothetical protein
VDGDRRNRRSIAAIGAAVLLVFVGIKTFKWVRRAM